jgi:hypothetical protein
MDDEPEIIFGGAWKKYQISHVDYNLRITYPDLDIYLYDDVTAAFRQPK